MWIEIAQEEMPFKRISDCVVLLGDHIKISKEGRRMPDVQVLRQDSENSGKSEYIEGHTHAQISAIISKDEVYRSLPLITELQKSPPKKEGTSKPDGDTLVTQMVNLAKKATESLKDNVKAVLALDAYFSKSSAFLAADNVVDESGNRRLEIITRARDDSVGYESPAPRPKGKRGAPSKYGKKIALSALFSDKRKFVEKTLTLYGKPTKVKYQCLDLIWKPLGTRMIRFVAVESHRGRMILMCSDLSFNPEDIITIYCLRFKIETGFNEQKNDMGIFSYRFWTSALPKRKRWTKNEILPQNLSARVELAKNAIDSFVCVGTIASGILTIIAFSHNRLIWNRYSGWLRTLRSNIPSLAVAKEVFAQDFPCFLQRHTTLSICSVINSRTRFTQCFYYDFFDIA
jgi:hypothetical protein